MPGVPRREYREPWLGTTAGGPERAAGVAAGPGPPMPIPPTASGALARTRHGSALARSVPTSRPASQSAGRSLSDVGSRDRGPLGIGGRRVLVEHAVFVER